MSFFDYMQIFFLIAYGVILFGWTLYLKQKQVNVWTLSKGEKSLLNRIIELLYFMGLVLWIAIIIIQAIGQAHILPVFLSKQFFDITVIKYIGVMISFSSVVIYIVALVHFGNSWRIGVDMNNPGSLVSQGVYSVSRNPMFLSFALYCFGSWLIYSNMIILLYLIVLLSSMQYQILKEENFLIKYHGDKYLKYMDEVKRYMTFLKRST